MESLDLLRRTGTMGGKALLCFSLLALLLTMVSEQAMAQDVIGTVVELPDHPSWMAPVVCMAFCTLKSLVSIAVQALSSRSPAYWRTRALPTVCHLKTAAESRVKTGSRSSDFFYMHRRRISCAVLDCALP